MFSFFKKKPAADPAPEVAPATEPAASPAVARSWLDRVRGFATGDDEPAPPPVLDVTVTAPPAAEAPQTGLSTEPEAPARSWLDRLRGVPGEPAPAGVEPAPQAVVEPEPPEAETFDEPETASSEPEPEPEPDRRGWLDKLRGGLRKTGGSITQVFTGTRIDESLYEELEAALLMADAGMKATEYLLMDLKWRVREHKPSDPAGVKRLLADAVTELLEPLERSLVVGEHVPTVMMVVGVNGAGKTTTIGKLTRHLADANRKVLLAAADTFRAAAREQLAAWAQRADQNPTVRTDQVEIVSQEGGDPAAVTYDAVVAGKARGCDVVIADTAGRLTTQLHLMEELKKIRRVIDKAQEGAPHEVLLVVDGNTGQNALSQVQLFDAALGLTGLIITKLDGTAKGGVLAAIALWSRERVRAGGRGVPVYFIGVGEKLEDLQTFDAREFAQALLT